MSTATVTGRVVTSNGWVIEGASVTVLGAMGQQLGRTMCDGRGEFTLPDVPSGAATLLVAAAGHQPKVQPVSVPRVEVWELGEVRLARVGATNAPAVGTWQIDPAHSSIRARAHHFGLGGVHGGFEDYEGTIEVSPQLEQSRVRVVIQAASINTGNAQRDEHLRSADFLDVANHPTLEFRCDRTTAAGEQWLMDGELTILDTTRPVTLTMDYVGSGPDAWGGTRAAFRATTTLRRQDFNITWNQAIAAGIDAIGTTLEVSIEVEAVKV